MAKARKKRPRRIHREPLVLAHLERVSRNLLIEHPDIVRRFIGRNTGVYALYRKNKLYYVGLASALRHRLTAHGKNRHGNLWDHFSIYLTVKDQHLREIEALLLRITKPPGAKQTGKLAQSVAMKRQILKAIQEKQHKEISSLFDRYVLVGGKKASSTLRADSELARFLPNGARLQAHYKGEVFKARARRDGRIRYNGIVYASLSLAAKAVVKRAVNGWWFWKIERSKGNWVRLSRIRKAGTPVYTR